MKRLPLALALLALAGGAVATVHGVRLERERRQLADRLESVTSHAAGLEAQFAAARAEAAALGGKLSALDADLGDTKAKLTASEARHARLAHELSQTKVQLAARELASEQLAGQLASLRRERDDARATAADAAGTVAAHRDAIAALERRLAAREGAALPAVPGAATAAFASRPRAAVLSVGPGSAFVVLDYGTGRGAQPGQRLSILRGTEPVATVLISDARPRFCVAQVRPDSLRGVLQKGDFAVLEN
jgi:hypothetical protein